MRAVVSGLALYMGTFRLCVFPNLGYSSKYFEKIYRTQYEAAMLVYIRCASGTYLGGRVEKTDPRSADYPLTPPPRTTLWTTPRTTLRTTPTDYPKKSTKFLLRSTKVQKAYLLFLHDHNCTKNSRHFLFLHFSTQSFSFCPILHLPATCQNAVSTMDDR